MITTMAKYLMIVAIQRLLVRVKLLLSFLEIIMALNTFSVKKIMLIMFVYAFPKK